MKNHWEKIYAHKTPDEMSWTQEKPEFSLKLIEKLQLSKQAKILDVGGGNSNLVDHLLALGYENISVLDISSAALEQSKKRLGEKAKKVNWIISDISEFHPKEKYDLWHDRAAFHFLTTTAEVDQYKKTLQKANPDFLILGTFSKQGPEKCSGLKIKQYDEKELSAVFEENYFKVKTQKINHKTPFNTFQNFLFCSFKKKNN